MKKHFSGFLATIFCLVVLLGSAASAARPSPEAAQVPAVTLKPDLTIGVDDGDENLMFGKVIRVDIDGKGNIYVLDYKFRKVAVFDRDGKLLRTIAVPEGQAPREATNLSGIAVTPSGTLFVNDMRKVIVYGPDGQYIRTFLVDFMISSIGCAGTEELIAIGPNGGKILHVFDQTGKLLASFGETFPPPAELEAMKEMPMFGAPVLFNCAKDGRIFVLNPHKYEVSVFKDRKLERVLEGSSKIFKPIQKMGRAFISAAARILPSGEFVFVCLEIPDPRVKKTADIFQSGKQIGSIDIPGRPHVTDSQGRIYFAEEEGFPKVVRYTVVKN
jgi:hypothetical protein